MTTPTTISKETVNGKTFVEMRALFVTPRGGCGVRRIFRIDGKTVTRDKWGAEKLAAFRDAGLLRT